MNCETPCVKLKTSGGVGKKTLQQTRKVSVHRWWGIIYEYSLNSNLHLNLLKRRIMMWQMLDLTVIHYIHRSSVSRSFDGLAMTTTHHIIQRHQLCKAPDLECLFYKHLNSSVVDYVRRSMLRFFPSKRAFMKGSTGLIRSWIYMGLGIFISLSFS